MQRQDAGGFVQCSRPAVMHTSSCHALLGCHVTVSCCASSPESLECHHLLAGSACLYTSEPAVGSLPHPLIADNSTVTRPTRQIPLSFKTTAQVAKVGPSLIAPSQTQRRCALTLTSEGPQYPQTASELPADSLQFYVTFLHSAKDFRAALDR